MTISAFPGEDITVKSPTITRATTAHQQMSC